MATVCIVLVCTVLHIATASIVNVALRKPASMSSRRDSRYRADTVVDGNTDTNGYGGNQIIDTGEGHPFAWWKVDLQREIQNATVRIFFRTDYKRKRNGVKLYTSTSLFATSNPTSQGQLCDTVTDDPSGSDIPDVYSVTCPGTWRYLLLYTDTDNDGHGPVLYIGEVEVYACSEETYGEDCTKTCSSRNCVTMPTTCNKGGMCPSGCHSGWTGVDCTQECDSGSYGPGCSLLCSERNCVEPSTECEHVTGQCRNGCKPGYKRIDCAEECESGTYENCSLSCTDRNCLVLSSECNHVTGQCEAGCQPGYQGTDCRQACYFGVTYGVSCIKFCTDRHCNQSSSECDTRTGQCTGGCQVGWRGVDCTSQCFLGTFGPRCGMYCGNCSSDEVCHHVTGICPSGCKAGWRSEKCNEVCMDGSYAPGCTEKCGKCDGVCDSVDGRCPAGCLDGYNGTKCDVDLSDATIKEPVYLGVASLAGAVVGSVIAVLLLGVGIHLCLIKQGRLQWIKPSEDKKQVQELRDFTQMSNISPQPVELSEHAQSINHVYNNDYAVLDAGTKTDNKDYDIIKPNYYQNL